jgi:hypothetical protein
MDLILQLFNSADEPGPAVRARRPTATRRPRIHADQQFA